MSAKYYFDVCYIVGHGFWDFHTYSFRSAAKTRKGLAAALDKALAPVRSGVKHNGLVVRDMPTVQDLYKLTRDYDNQMIYEPVQFDPWGEPFI